MELVLELDARVVELRVGVDGFSVGLLVVLLDVLLLLDVGVSLVVVVLFWLLAFLAHRCKKLYL